MAELFWLGGTSPVAIPTTGTSSYRAMTARFENKIRSFRICVYCTDFRVVTLCCLTDMEYIVDSVVPNFYANPLFHGRNIQYLVLDRLSSKIPEGLARPPF